MGLSISHDAWEGSYSAFNRWREILAKHAGIQLNHMQGFVRDGGGIAWDALKPRPLWTLLRHSDAEGTIHWQELWKLADDLEAMIPELENEPDAGGHVGHVAEKTWTFIEGCRDASRRLEDLEFH